MSGLSQAQRLVKDGKWRKWIGSLTQEERYQLEFKWSFWSRPEQRIPEGDHTVWFYNAGRGSGKTRAGGEWTHAIAESARYPRIHLIAPTASDARDTMVEGESGILACAKPWFRPDYEPSKRKLTWPNGVIALLFSAEEPDRLRGPQCYAMWMDELGSWKYPETYDMAMLGLRLGSHPLLCITSTPKPVRLIRDLHARFKAGDPSIAVTLGTIYDNRANLAPSFFTHIVSKYEGTRLGQQELLGLLLEQAEGALWSREMLEHTRRQADQIPEFSRIVVAIDPAVSSDEDSDETGIVAGGLGVDGHGYILTDHSGRFTPNEWAQRAINEYDLRSGDRIVGEANNGGDMIESTLRTIRPNISYRKLHASKGKQTRAEPVVSLFEQNKAHLVGSFPDLEDQLCNWEPNTSRRSPDRLDAMVWCLTELMVDKKAGWGDYYPATDTEEERAQ